MLEPWEDSAQVRDDDGGGLGKSDLSREVFKKFNPICATVRHCSFARYTDRILRFDGIDSPRAKLAREQRQHAWATAEIHHDRIGFNCVTERRRIRLHTRSVGKHLAVKV